MRVLLVGAGGAVVGIMVAGRFTAAPDTQLLVTAVAVLIALALARPWWR